MGGGSHLWKRVELPGEKEEPSPTCPGWPVTWCFPNCGQKGAWAPASQSAGLLCVLVTPCSHLTSKAAPLCMTHMLAGQGDWFPAKFLVLARLGSSTSQGCLCEC
jgi:hypothetical protein